MFTFYVHHEPTLCSPKQQMIHTRGKRPVFTAALFPLYKLQHDLRRFLNMYRYIHLVSRMFGLQYLTRLIRADMRIYLRCSDRTVTEELLNIPYIHIFIVEFCSKSMSEHMWCDMQWCANSICVIVYHISYGLLR